MFDEGGAEDTAQAELRQAAEALKSKNKDADNHSSTRIKDASVINDLRKDPRLRNTVDQFMADIGEKAKWFQRPGAAESDRSIPRERRDPRDTSDWRQDVRCGRLWPMG